MTATLHYIYDPLCGWCYCTEPLVNAARNVDGLSIRLHGGGLWPEPTRLPDEMRQYIREADRRAAAISGQPYGDRYLDELLSDPQLTLDSWPTTAAVLAAEARDPALAWPMLQAIQHAHWEHGRHVVEPDVLHELAIGIGLDPDDYARALAAADVDAHIGSTHLMMREFGIQGFPAFVLQRGDQWIIAENQRYLSDPAGFADWLGEQLG
jgi:putative protein-disulfide isomerase